jgi:hypothetical protein
MNDLWSPTLLECLLNGSEDLWCREFGLVVLVLT